MNVGLLERNLAGDINGTSLPAAHSRRGDVGNVTGPQAAATHVGFIRPAESDYSATIRGPFSYRYQTLCLF